MRVSGRHNLIYIVILSHPIMRLCCQGEDEEERGCLSQIRAHQLWHPTIPEIDRSRMCANLNSQMGNLSFGLHIDDVMAKYNFPL